MAYLLVEKVNWDSYIEEAPLATTKRDNKNFFKPIIKKEIEQLTNKGPVQDALLKRTSYEIVKIKKEFSVNGIYFAHELTSEAHGGYIECEVVVLELENGKFAITTDAITKKYPVVGISTISDDWEGKFTSGTGDELKVYK